MINWYKNGKNIGLDVRFGAGLVNVKAHWIETMISQVKPFLVPGNAKYIEKQNTTGDTESLALIIRCWSCQDKQQQTFHVVESSGYGVGLSTRSHVKQIEISDFI